MSGHALPRARTRRRKPRGPGWRRRAAMCVFWALFLILSVCDHAPYGAVGAALMFAIAWKEMHHAPCDPEARPLTFREETQTLLAAVAALTLFITGLLA